MGKKGLIEQVYTRSEKGIVPTLLSFQNGNLTATQKDKVQYCTMVKGETKSKEAFIAVEGNVYTGPINANEANELTELYICVRNKETNKVRIMPIDQASLKNQIHDKIQQKELESLNKKVPTDRIAAKKKFIQEFSGSKAKRLMDNREKMNISLDVIKEGVETTIEQTILDDGETDTQRATYVELISPKCNKIAEKIDDIYDINELVPKDLLDKLNDVAEAVFNATNEELPIKSAFLMSCLVKIKQSSETRDEILHKIKILLFMDSLYNLMTTKGRDVFKMELSGLSGKVENYIRRNFPQPGSLPIVKLKKKALCYYIVLCMLLEDTRAVDTKMLAQELGIRLPEIIQHAHLVNALPSKNKDNKYKDFVALTLPRKVPPMKAAFNRKRRTL